MYNNEQHYSNAVSLKLFVKKVRSVDLSGDEIGIISGLLSNSVPKHLKIDIEDES